MRVLIAASEAVPFAKTGGLADVIGSLPKALQNEDCDVRVIMPKYGTIAETYKQKMQHITSITVDVGWRKQFCGIEQMEYGGIHFYFIDNQYYFYRERIYGFFDEAERFAFFCSAVLASIPHLDFSPNIIHCHDWQTALISVFLHTKYRDNPAYRKTKTILTIHNLQYQGIYDIRIASDILGLDDVPGEAERVRFNGDANYLKGGLVSSDIITTVSHTYAEEITYAYYGERLEGILRALGKVHGITNGIDYQEYDPMTDRAIPFNYRSSPAIKKKNKKVLQEQVGLPIDEDIPLLAIVSRLTPQKGLDLIECVLDEILQETLQLVILGSGDARYEKMFTEAALRYQGKMSAQIRFDDQLARLIYAGSDMFLMPSHFEPCGLSQLIALRYGSIPIVRETGGLKDTVQPYNEYTKEGNGFSFTNYNAHEMLYAIRRALAFYQNPIVWKQIIGNAIKSDNSWHRAAEEYLKIYGQLVEQEV